jgi:hypothetical protein
VLARREVLVKPRAGWWVVAILWLHQVAIALLSPPSADDWTARIDGPLAPTLGGVYHWLIAGSQIAHVALTPLGVVALPLGLATLVRGRRLRLGDADDALWLAAVAAALWLAVPQFGLACSYRLAAATHVIGLAAAVWAAIGFRALAAWSRRGGAAIGAPGLAAIAVACVLAGATTRALSLATLATCGVIAARARGNRRWAIAGLGGLAVGAALAWLSDLAALRIHVAHDIDGELYDFGAWIRIPGWVATGVVASWLVHAGVQRARGREPEALGDDALAAIGRALALAIATAAFALVSTDVTSFEVIAPGAAVAVIAAIIGLHLAGPGHGRIAVAAIALVIQLRVTVGSIHALVDAHHQFADRIAALTRAPRGTVAVIPAYARHTKTWFFGEDFRISLLRDRVATHLFGLRGIALSPAMRDFQDVPPLALHHEVDGVAAGFPAFYSVDLATAREQFAAAATHPARSARLVVDGLVVPDRTGEPVLAAWTEGAGQVVAWELERRDPDREGQLVLAPRSDGPGNAGLAGGVQAMWVFDLATGAAETPLRAEDGTFRLRPARHMAAGIVACTAARCALTEVVGIY